jgi:hypothetical protein
MKLENLAYFFIRGAAISCVHHQFGFDLVLPVCLENGQLTAIFVQVKNYNTDIKAGTSQALKNLMMKAAKSIFDPVNYEKIVQSEKAQKAKRNKKNTKNVTTEQFLALNNNEESLDNSSIFILVNLKQGDGRHAKVKVYADERYVEAQGLALGIYPNLWGKSPQEKHESLMIMRRLLESRMNYNLELKFKTNMEYRKLFFNTDHDHRRATVKDNAELKKAKLSSSEFLSTKPRMLGDVKIPKTLTWSMMDDLYRQGLPDHGVMIALKKLPEVEQEKFGIEIITECRKIANEIDRLGSRKKFQSEYRQYLQPKKVKALLERIDKVTSAPAAVPVSDDGGSSSPAPAHKRTKQQKQAPARKRTKQQEEAQAPARKRTKQQEEAKVLPRKRTGWHGV